MKLPANTTNRLQPMDISVNKAAKDFFRHKFNEWLPSPDSSTPTCLPPPLPHQPASPHNEKLGGSLGRRMWLIFFSIFWSQLKSELVLPRTGLLTNGWLGQHLLPHSTLLPAPHLPPAIAQRLLTVRMKTIELNNLKDYFYIDLCTWKWSQTSSLMDEQCHVHC